LIALAGLVSIGVGSSALRSSLDATLPFSDNFTAADGSPLSGYWTVQSGGVQVMGNTATGVGGKVDLATLNGVSQSPVRRSTTSQSQRPPRRRRRCP
jgi:hypothetical protein